MDLSTRENINIPTISSIVKEEKIHPPVHLQEENPTLLTDQIRVRESWAQIESDLMDKQQLNELKNKDGNVRNALKEALTEENNCKGEIKNKEEHASFLLDDSRQLLANALKEELTKEKRRKSEVCLRAPNSPKDDRSDKRKSAPSIFYPDLEIKELNDQKVENSLEIDKEKCVIESSKSDESFDPDLHKREVAETLPMDESVSDIIREDVAKQIDDAPKIGIRHWQILLYSFVVFLGLGFRVTLSLAIVAMTDPSVSCNKNIPTYPEWQDQSVILSAFFWGYIIPQVFAGWMASRYGPKWFLIGAMGLCSVMSLLIPLAAATFGSLGVMFCRAVQGLSQGFFFPALHHVISQWVPPSERSRLGGFVYSANPIGTVVAMVVSGAIAASNFGWPWIFYVYGLMGLSWCLISIFFAYNSPKECSVITFGERAYIENSLGHGDEPVGRRTPWKKIFTSLPVWAILVTMFGQNWGFWTLITEMPLYLNNVMSFNIQNNSILSALPYLALWITSFGMNYTCDKLIIRNMLSIGAARKTFNSIGLVFPAIALIFLGYTSPDNPQRAVALLVVAIALNAGTFCGYLVNHVDLSPNNAGVLMGITNCLSNISGILAPLTVQIIVTEKDNPEQWKIIFFLAAAIYLATNLFFVIFGSGKVQAWNEEDNKTRGSTKNIP